MVWNTLRKLNTMKRSVIIQGKLKMGTHLPGRGRGHIYLDILEQSDAVRGDQACCQNL